jgi:DNA polymerase III subunit alpha
MYLNSHTYYSFKYGTMSPEQLLAEAKQKGIAQIALTDINNTSGILDFFRLAPKYNVKPVAGIDFRNGAEQKFIGIAKNINGFKELNDLLSKHLGNGEPFENSASPFDDAWVIYPFSKVKRKLRENEFIGIKPSELNKLIFSDVKYLRNKLVVLQPVTFLEKDMRIIPGKREAVTFFTNHIHYAHRLIRAMDNNTLISKLDKSEVADKSEIMLTESKLRQVFSDYSFAIENTSRLLNECHIDFSKPENKNKSLFTGSIAGDEELLRKECKKGMQYRYGNADNKIQQRYEKEIKTIIDMGFTSYFLINWDIVRYARNQGLFYVGRGSGANSMVAYLLNITDVDPIDLDLYFERFINTSRKNPPDFDIDFSSNERNKIIEYIFKKYGEEHTALLATYSTLQENAVLRELGKVYGLPKNEIDTLTDDMLLQPGKINKYLLAYSHFLKDFPSHLSIHAGGVLISDKPIHCYTATNFPPKEFSLTQFSMLEAEDIGLNKFDILAQRGLGKIKDAVEIIRQNKNVDIDIHEIEKFKKDDAIKANLQNANLMGCFYVESPAMRMLLTKLKATTYLHLVAASSIIRPGVAQSGMMREYILRFHHPERRQYAHSLMKDLMEETFGVMVYQEDVIKVAHHFGKLTLEESDKLRRGMGGKYRGRKEFLAVRDVFFSNCRKEGYDEKLIEEVWRQMESFGGYAFAKGHSASYAVESYQCMFLKTYYPLEYMVAVINNGGGFYALEFYVHEAKQCGATIHLPDINKSDYFTCIYNKDIYLGLNLLKDSEKNTSEKILTERNLHGNFSSLEDFMKRVSVSVEQLRILIRIGAFRFTGRTKKQLLWDIHSIIGANKKTEVRNELFEVSNRKFQLPELYDGKFDDAFDELEILGFSLCSPFELLTSPSAPLSRFTSGQAGRGEKVEFASELKNHLGKIVSIVGYLVTTKYARTKHGDEMNFGTFLDKNGKWIDTTHFPQVVKQYPFTGRRCCYLITGKVVVEFGFYSLDVVEMRRLDFITREEMLQAQ